MPDELAEGVWVLTCRRCLRTVDFNEVHEPFLYLATWARCCGEIMELESVLRRRASGGERVNDERRYARPEFASARIEKAGRYAVTIDGARCRVELADDLSADERRELIDWFGGGAVGMDARKRRVVEDA
jgi:hypothetical protein